MMFKSTFKKFAYPSPSTFELDGVQVDRKIASSFDPGLPLSSSWKPLMSLFKFATLLSTASVYSP